MEGLKGDRIVYARGEDWVQVRAEPGGDYFYGTLTKSGDVIRWRSIDGKGSAAWRAAPTRSGWSGGCPTSII